MTLSVLFSSRSQHQNNEERGGCRILRIFLYVCVLAPHLLACGGRRAAAARRSTVAPSREEIFVHATDHIANDGANDSVSVFIHL